MPFQPSFAIIGAGFSGSLLAVHLLRRLPPYCRVHLIERGPGFGCGLAYSTSSASHLLNVRAGRMSAFEDQPDHFLAWLVRQPEGEGAHANSFVRRSLYGRYMQSLLGAALWGTDRPTGLTLVPDEAVALSSAGPGLSIELASGRILRVGTAVLAVGNFPPEVPRDAEMLRQCPRFIGDPWDEGALRRIRGQDPLLLIGTGLTMADVLMGLTDHGHQGPVIALSRRGLLPHVQGDGLPALPWGEQPLPFHLSALLAETRQRVRRSGAGGDNWQAVLDGMRPQVQAWWDGMDRDQRRRFLRHLRPWWEIHRHRLPPQMGERLTAFRAQGRLQVLAGRIADVAWTSDHVTLSYRQRGGDALTTLQASYLVNCSGPSSDFRQTRHPLLRHLLQAGQVRPDGLRLGLDVDPSLRLLDTTGRPHDRLFAVGPLTRGRFWDITAVPEIRRQTQALAERLAAEASLA